MKHSIYLWLFLLSCLSCRPGEEATPNGYLKALSLTMEARPTGFFMAWTPVWIFEEGMYWKPGDPVQTAPTQYEIYVSESYDRGFVKVATVDGSQHTYEVTNQPTGKTLYAQVKAIHPRLASSGSNVATTNVGLLGVSVPLFGINPPFIVTADWGQGNVVYAGYSDLTIRQADGNARVLAGKGIRPVLSPDGRYVAFLGGFDNNTAASTKLLIETVATGEIRLLDTQRGIGAVAWSNDGKRLAYTTYNDFWTVAATGGQPARVDGATFSFTSQQIDWSADDTYLLYSDQKLTQPQNRYATNLMQVPVAGGKPSVLLESIWQDEQPVFSPDHRRLAFYSNRSGYRAVWVMDMQTKIIRQLTAAAERPYYQNRLDWRTNTTLTYSAYGESSSQYGSVLHEVTVP